jgi:dienelactone hydrolase
MQDTVKPARATSGRRAAALVEIRRIRAGVRSGKYFAANVGRRTFDAFGAPFFLAHQAFIDARRVGVVGFSQGGWVTLSPRTNPLPRQSAAHRGCAEPQSHARDWSRRPQSGHGPFPVLARHAHDQCCSTSRVIDEFSPALPQITLAALAEEPCETSRREGCLQIPLSKGMHHVCRPASRH